MRELKFRAWWKDAKRFLDGDEWYMTCSGSKHLHYSCYPYKDDDFVIEQYTGLKDMDGKEIYEGDIVWWEHYNGMNGKMSEHKAEVYYDENLAGYFVSYFDTSLSELLMEEDVYVSTNIHDNKEVMNGHRED